MKPYELLTIGYEGRDIGDFISRLKYFSVTRLIDVREIPLSRKKGFSKSALRERLESEDIEYVHLRSLGSPKEIRKKLEKDWDYEYFFKAYQDYLAKNSQAIEEIYKYILNGVNCIMCFEKNYSQCHRNIIVQKVKNFGLTDLNIKHI